MNLTEIGFGGRVDKSQASTRVLSHTNPVLILTLYLFNIQLILFFHLRLALPCSLFLSDFQNADVYMLLISMHAACFTHLISLGFVTLIIFGETKSTGVT